MNPTSQVMLENNLPRVEDLLKRKDLLKQLGLESKEALAFLWDVRRHTAKGLDNLLRMLNGESFDQIFPNTKPEEHPSQQAAS